MGVCKGKEGEPFDQEQFEFRVETSFGMNFITLGSAKLNFSS